MVEVVTLSDGRLTPVHLVSNARARRYLLRVKQDGTVRLTVPRRGTVKEARAFLLRSVPWLEQALRRIEKTPRPNRAWFAGATAFFRGEPVLVDLKADGTVLFGGEAVGRANAGEDLRPIIERHMVRIANRELPARTIELALRHGMQINRVAIRNQRSRWGSCSSRRTISLNWRLIQTPDFVRDYIILHELMHLKQMNHSAKFWAEVEAVCPDYRAAERWLKQNRILANVVTAD